MATLYRLLTGDDTSAFCHKVSQALSQGWMLHGSPAMTFDPVQGGVRCAQAVIKETVADYSPDLKLGQQ